LIGGLSADSVVKHPEALQVFPEVQLIDFDTATKDALEKTHPNHIERVWVDGYSKSKSLKHEGCFILHKVSPLPLGDGLGVRENRTPFGQLWFEQDGVSQTIFFSPRGLPGFLYWYLLYPFHWLRFRGLLRKIAKPS